MVTTTVGVRELKAQATRLVQRASQGERVVITRYGKPLAVLGPPEDEAAPRGSRVSEWERERQAFGRLMPRLEKKYAGEYVAVHRGRVIASDAEAEALYQRTWKKLRGATFFIGRVGGFDVIEMPSVTVR